MARLIMARSWAQRRMLSPISGLFSSDFCGAHAQVRLPFAAARGYGLA
jgi:hypothetical protein